MFQPSVLYLISLASITSSVYSSHWLQSPGLYTLLTGFSHQFCILFSLASITSSVYSSHWLQLPGLYILFLGFSNQGCTHGPRLSHQVCTYFLGSATRAVPMGLDSVTRSVLILRGFSKCFEDVRYKKTTT